jgi:hypothetical protein
MGALVVVVVGVAVTVIPWPGIGYVGLTALTTAITGFSM